MYIRNNKNLHFFKIGWWCLRVSLLEPQLEDWACFLGGSEIAATFKLVYLRRELAYL